MLKCSASVLGKVIPVTWFKNNVRLVTSKSGDYFVGSEGHLVFLTVHFDDRGVYKCVAENEAGRVSGTAYLGVRAKIKQRGKRTDHVISMVLKTYLFMLFMRSSGSEENDFFVKFFFIVLLDFTNDKPNLDCVFSSVYIFLVMKLFAMNLSNAKGYTTMENPSDKIIC